MNRSFKYVFHIAVLMFVFTSAVMASPDCGQARDCGGTMDCCRNDHHHKKLSSTPTACQLACLTNGEDPVGADKALGSPQFEIKPVLLLFEIVELARESESAEDIIVFRPYLLGSPLKRFHLPPQSHPNPPPHRSVRA